MITTEIISKIFTEAIVKCGYNTIGSNGFSWGVRFPVKVRKELNDFHHRTCTLGHQQEFEELLLLDKNGDNVFNTTGEEHRVSFNLYEVSRIREETGRELYDVHNHPHGYYGIPTCLSLEDLDVLTDKSLINPNEFLFKSISASTANGSRMTVMKNNNFNEENFNDYKTASNHLVETYIEYVNEFKNTKVEVVNDILTDDMSFTDIFTNEDLIKQVNDETIKRLGKFEDRIPSIREEFNKCNVELSIEWVK